MSSTRNDRIKKELRALCKDPLPNCMAGPVNDNLTLWEGTLMGPDDSPYEGGVFKLEIRFPDKYPFEAPRVRFLTPIFHCNISKNGNICLDILKKEWSPVLTMDKLLLSILSLLTDANPNDPLTPDIADVYIEDRAKHDRIAKEWTRKYAISV